MLLLLVVPGRAMVLWQSLGITIYSSMYNIMTSILLRSRARPLIAVSFKTYSCRLRRSKSIH
jgi:hypothetical protein